VPDQPSRIRSWVTPGRIAFAIVGVASFALILYQGRGTTFSQDELFYYARAVLEPGSFASHPFGLEYLLAPSNGHLVVLGKLIYEGLFATAGRDYVVFRVVEALAVVACAGLFFELARTRVTELPALVLTILVLFLGAAWEALLWPFNVHTLLSLGAGLGAVMAIEANTRRGDIAACVLLVVSIAAIELGLAFLVGIAIQIGLRDRSARKAWIVVLPLFLYGVWWVWARRFEQSDITLSNLEHVPRSIIDSIGSTIGGLSGAFETGPAVVPQVLGIESWTSVVGIVAVALLLLRLASGRIPRTLWVFVAVALVYWGLIGLAARPPDSSRYMFVGAVLILLIVVDALRSPRISVALTVVAVGVVILSLPAQLEKLSDGRRLQVADATGWRTEFAMLDLARANVDPSYLPSADPRVAAAGPGGSFGVPAGLYFDGADRVGSLGLPLAEVRREPAPLRAVADATLTGALRLALSPGEPPPNPDRCRVIGGAGRPGRTRLGPGGAVVRARGEDVSLGLGRFLSTQPSVEVGQLAANTRQSLAIPTDSAPEPWWLFADGPVRACPLLP
jgi:hypothetical protein